MAITASEARRTLFPLIQQVNDDATAIEITSKNGSAFLVSAAEWSALQETAFLLRSPENAKRLMDSMAQVDAAAFTERALAQ